MRYFLVVIFVGMSIFSFAEKKVSRAIYEEEIDQLNCELAKFYMKKNQNLDTLSLYEDSLAITGCNFEHLMVFIKERQPAMQTNGELAVYINHLKENYENSINNNVLYNKLVDVFKMPILDEYANDDTFIELKNTFVIQLRESLKVTKIEHVVNQELTQTNSFMENFENFGWQEATLILMIVLIIILTGWFYKYRKNRKIKASKKNQLNKNTTEKTEVKSNNSVEKTLTINESYAKSKSETEGTVTTIVHVPPPTKTQIIDETPADVVETKIEELPNEDIFYMPYPSVDGSFYEYGKHDLYEEGRSTFRFEIKLKEYNLATFEVISNQDVITDALMNFEKTLNAVCEVVGKGTEYNENHEIIVKPGLKSIVTIEPGTVQLKTQHWRLKQKAKIRLEY